MDATDSVQCLGTSAVGQWLCADGTTLNARICDAFMQNGRGLAITPPDPSDPTNPAKQFYFVSQNMRAGNAIISGCFPIDSVEKQSTPKEGEGNLPPKILTSPDWNRTKAAFVPYQIKIGQIPGGATRGPQHNLFFMMGARGGGSAGNGLQAEWMIRNIRLYEEGSPDPGPMTFDPSQFSVRGAKKGNPSATAPLTTVSETAPPVPPKPAKPANASPIPSGTVTVADNGHSVHLKDAPSVNYPVNYTITPNTILAFDLDVIDHTHAGKDNGIGLSPDSGGDNKENASHCFNFLGGHDPRSGIKDPSAGAFAYPTYVPNTLYTDSIPLPPAAPANNHSSGGEMKFLWQPGFYGLKISENGKFLFACNNADNRLEVRDISTDGHAVAKIPIDYPMFVTLAPDGAAGARQGTRFVYVDSPNAGLLRIAWNISDNTFGKPETITPASEFAYPRGLVYNSAAGRIFVCDTFNLDRSKQANQIAVIDPKNGAVLLRFGKQGGVDPATGGKIDDETFTCPLCIDADSKGALWVNDFYSCEMRKYNFDPASNGFKLERRVLGPGYRQLFSLLLAARRSAHGGLDTCRLLRAHRSRSRCRWSLHQPAKYVRHLPVDSESRASFPHFCKVGDHIYAVFGGEDTICEQVGDGWVPRFGFEELMATAKRI